MVVFYRDKRLAVRKNNYYCFIYALFIPLLRFTRFRKESFIQHMGLVQIAVPQSVAGFILAHRPEDHAAVAHLAATALTARVTAVCTDAAAFLQENRAACDFILLNTERPVHPDYWPHLKSCLAASSSLLVVKQQRKCCGCPAAVLT